jgi:hypothetical protein
VLNLAASSEGVAKPIPSQECCRERKKNVGQVIDALAADFHLADGERSELLRKEGRQRIDPKRSLSEPQVG